MIKFGRIFQQPPPLSKQSFIRPHPAADIILCDAMSSTVMREKVLIVFVLNAISRLNIEVFIYAKTPTV